MEIEKLEQAQHFVQAVADILVGKVAWGAALGYGSFLTLEFGEAWTLENGGKRGELHLWLYGCAWRIEKDGFFIVGSQDDRVKIDQLIGELLNGQQIESVEVNQANLDTLFSFSHNLSLYTFSNSSDMEHWLLYLPKSRVLSAGPGYSWHAFKQKA